MMGRGVAGKPLLFGAVGDGGVDVRCRHVQHLGRTFNQGVGHKVVTQGLGMAAKGSPIIP